VNWDRERLRITYHECAHAAAHLSLGASSVTWLSVTGYGRSLDGKCFYDPARPENAYAMLVALLAGPACDKHFFDLEPDIRTGDWRNAGDFASRISGLDVEAALVRGQKFARLLVSRYAGAIEQLAAQLFKVGGDLDGEAATRIRSGPAARHRRWDREQALESPESHPLERTSR
jgi:hypothetical protein